MFPSLCDPFDQEIPIEWKIDFWKLVWATQNLTWLLLTKRPEGFERDWTALKNADVLAYNTPLPPNVWLGVSVEDQQRADERIPVLLSIPAKVRFLTVEPLLGPVEGWFGKQGGWLKGEKIDWVIVGGESGPNRRDCGVDNIVSVVRQCQDAGVPVFVKQDCSLRPGQQGRIPSDIWAIKQFPNV